MEPESLENILASFEADKMDHPTLVRTFANRATRACNYVLSRVWSTDGRDHHLERTVLEKHEFHDGSLQRIAVNTLNGKARGRAELGSEFGHRGTIDFWICIDPKGRFFYLDIEGIQLRLPGGDANDFLEKVRHKLAPLAPG